MAKWLTVIVVFCLVTCLAVPAMAQEEGAGEVEAASEVTYNMPALSAIAAGVVVLGAGLGIGRIGGSATESMARQPEFAANIQTAMIIAAALIEGAALFGLVICLAK